MGLAATPHFTTHTHSGSLFRQANPPTDYNAIIKLSKAPAKASASARAAIHVLSSLCRISWLRIDCPSSQLSSAVSGNGNHQQLPYHHHHHRQQYHHHQQQHQHYHPRQCVRVSVSVSPNQVIVIFGVIFIQLSFLSQSLPSSLVLLRRSDPCAYPHAVLLLLSIIITTTNLFISECRIIYPDHLLCSVFTFVFILSLVITTTSTSFTSVSSAPAPSFSLFQ